MKTTPILFSGPMIKAIIAGRKTQTRRALNPQPTGFVWRHGWDAKNGATWTAGDGDATESGRIRWWAGDLLYARETWKPHSLYDHLPPRAMPKVDVFYEADGKYSPSGSRWHPSIHMPRWASRITLVVEDVRVERLQAISEADAIAEGVWTAQAAEESGRRDRSPGGGKLNHIGAYASLWEDINGPGAWAVNPWVAAITFRPLIANVDTVLADPAAYGIGRSA